MDCFATMVEISVGGTSFASITGSMMLRVCHSRVNQRKEEQ